jgi:hypothetical protein
MSKKIKVAMICTHKEGWTYPAFAVAHANELSTAQVFAEVEAKQQGAVKVEFPEDFKALPKKWQAWLMKQGVLDVAMQQGNRIDSMWRTINL